jgi:hypothetical protein
MAGGLGAAALCGVLTGLAKPSSGSFDLWIYPSTVVAYGLLALAVLAFAGAIRGWTFPFARKALPQASVAHAVRAPHSQREAAEDLAATDYSLVSRKLELVFQQADSTVTVGMRFENVGPSHLRWQMEIFRVSIEDQKALVSLFLVRQGTLGVGHDFLYESKNNPVDLTKQTKGQLEFSFLYGPPQHPQARRLHELWRFEVTPQEEGDPKLYAYKGRTSDEPCLPSSKPSPG